MWVVDASVIIALGRQGRLDLLSCLDEVTIPSLARDEVTGEPEASNLADFLEPAGADLVSPPAAVIERAAVLLGDDLVTGDTAIIASIMAATDEAATDEDSVGVISDDKRLRSIAGGLGAAVTGTIGLIVHNVDEGQLTSAAAKRLVRDMERRGFHLTGELRDTADRLIDQAAEEHR